MHGGSGKKWLLGPALPTATYPAVVAPLQQGVTTVLTGQLSHSHKQTSASRQETSLGPYCLHIRITSLLACTVYSIQDAWRRVWQRVEQDASMGSATSTMLCR